jgi:hypothetical protein
VAARTIGGECAKVLEFASGHSIETLAICAALDRPLPAMQIHHSAGVLMLPTPKSGILKRIEGILAAQQVPLIESIAIAIREGHELVSLPEGSGYLGFIFATGPSAAEVEHALRSAYDKLTIVVSPLWKIAETAGH